jgi:phosphatidylglycerol---prolipoprotein diacylglyceryl transferase
MKPILLEWNNFILYSYPLFLGLAWGLGYQAARYLFKTYGPGINGFNLLIVKLFIYSWIGAKLFFIFFSAKGLAPMTNLSFWLGGGFVFYGGVVGGGIFLSTYCYQKKKSFTQHLALLIPALCFAHAVGRLGCFLAGCCFGEETTAWLGVVVNGVTRHPVQLYEALILLILGTVGIWILKTKKPYSIVIIAYFLGYGLGRFLLEFFRADAIRGIGSWGSTSQWISLIMILGALIYTIIELRKKYYA